MNEHLDDYIGCSCEVKTMDNDLLLSGKIKSVFEDEKGQAIEIISPDGEDMLTAAYGLPVKINMYSNKCGFIGLGGKIYISNCDFWRINEINTLGENERRDYFRIKTHTYAKVIGPNTENKIKAFKCTVISVSLSGVLFAVDDDSCYFPVGTQIEVRGLRVLLDGSFFDVRCEVCRVDESRKLGKLYGCKFLEQDPRDTDRLCQNIFAKQRCDIKKRRGMI